MQSGGYVSPTVSPKKHKINVARKLNFSFKTYLMYGHRAFTAFLSTATIYLNRQSIKIQLVACKIVWNV